MFFEQLCNLPSHLLVKEFFIHRFIHRLMNYFDNPRRQVGFIPDMHRILEKYSLTFALQDFMEHGRFLSKYSWKRLLTERMSSQCRNELLLKANDSASLTRFLKIHDSPEPYMLYHVIRETPKLCKWQVSSPSIGFFCFLVIILWYIVCRSCGVVTNKLTEHLLLFCTDNETFRTRLWQSLIYRFGVNFFNRFITLSPADQVNSLFSRCSNILQNEVDMKYCFRLFVVSLGKINFTQRIQL